jgi:predicted DNA-binding protein YlxM (UPF0122 family)
MTNFNVPTRGEVSSNNQEIFDNLKKACLHLENYEEKLNLLEKHHTKFFIFCSK